MEELKKDFVYLVVVDRKEALEKPACLNSRKLA